MSSIRAHLLRQEAAAKDRPSGVRTDLNDGVGVWRGLDINKIKITRISNSNREKTISNMDQPTWMCSYSRFACVSPSLAFCAAMAATCSSSSPAVPACIHVAAASLHYPSV